MTHHKYYTGALVDEDDVALLLHALRLLKMAFRKDARIYKDPTERLNCRAAQQAARCDQMDDAITSMKVVMITDPESIEGQDRPRERD